MGDFFMRSFPRLCQPIRLGSRLYAWFDCRQEGQRLQDGILALLDG
jgi:hypothetical protein